jgi:hypothetical protein
LHLIKDYHYKTHGLFSLSITSKCLLQESQDQDLSKAEDATPLNKPTTKDPRTTHRSTDSSRSHTSSLLTIGTKRVTWLQLLSNTVNTTTAAEVSVEVPQEKAMREDIRTTRQEARDTPTINMVLADLVKAKEGHTSSTPVSEGETSRTNNHHTTREAAEPNNNKSHRADTTLTLRANPRVDLYSKS